MGDASLLDGKAIAQRLRQGLEEQLRLLPTPPQLRVLYFNTPASLTYWNAQRATAASLGIGTGGAGSVAEWWRGSVCCSTEATQEQVEQVIQGWNEQEVVHGIFVHQPMPPQLDPQRISTVIDPRKDVEGIHPQNSARRFFAKARIGSCTALAVMELIEEAQRRSEAFRSLEGKEAVVIGHSEIVGRPVSMLLLDKLATTTVCHAGTDRAGRLPEHVGRADILVVAVGKPRVIKGAWIKPGAIVIDVGINVVDRKVVGDVEFEAARARAAFISPVPGGVGPVTVMTVMKNTIEAYRLQSRPAQRS